MKYVVVSAVVTDEIHFPDGNVKIAPGGAGFYALCGLRLWSDQVVAVTGIGEDYEKLHGEWYRRNHISMEGFRIKDARSPYTIVENSRTASGSKRRRLDWNISALWRQPGRR